MSELAVRNVRVEFDGVVVLADANLDAGSGEVVALLGPSGSGKSTLLRVVAGLLVPDAGRVLIGGVDVTEVATHRRRVGMVFQDNQLFPHRNVRDNVAFGLQMQRVDRRQRDERAEGWLRRVGLDGFGGRRVTELSGGEAKRVALARTLIAEPDVVLLDEPLTGLDRELHERLTGEVATVLRSTGVTTVHVTHDAEEAERVADRVLTIAEVDPASSS